MQAQRKYRRGGSIPVIVAVSVAVAGQVLVLFNDFGPSNNSRSNGNMITAAAVSRAGAIEIPSGPPAGRPQLTGVGGPGGLAGPPLGNRVPMTDTPARAGRP